MKAKHWLAAFIAVVCGIINYENAVHARSTTSRSHQFDHRTKNNRKWKVPSTRVHGHSTAKRLLARSTVVASKHLTPFIQTLKSHSAPSFPRSLGPMIKSAGKPSPKETFLLNSLKKQKAALAKKVELARKEHAKYLNPQTRQMVSAAVTPPTNIQQYNSAENNYQSNWQKELPAATRDTSSAYQQQSPAPAPAPTPAPAQPQQQQADNNVANAQPSTYQQQGSQEWQQYDARDTAPAPAASTSPAAAAAPAPSPAPAAAAAPAPPPAPAPAPAASAPADPGMQANYQDDTNGQTIEVPGPDGKPVSYYVNSNSADIVPDPKGGMKVVTPKGSAQPVNANQQHQKTKAHAQSQPQPQQQTYDTSSATTTSAAAATSTDQPKPELEQHQSAGAAKRVYSLGDKVFASAGCYQDKWIRAIPTLEGNHEFLMDPDYKSRGDALQKCAEAALEKSFKAFALQNHGQCFAGKDGEKRYKMYGSSNKCPGDGLGGPWSSEVYLVQDVLNPEASESHETAAAKSPAEIEKEQQEKTKPKPASNQHKKKKQHEAEAEEAEVQSSESDPAFNKAMQKEEEELIEAEKEETELTGGSSKPKSSGNSQIHEASVNEVAESESSHKAKNETTDKHVAKIKYDVQPVLSETNIPLNLNVKIRQNTSTPSEQTVTHSPSSEGKTGETSETQPVSATIHAASQPVPTIESHTDQQQQPTLMNRTIDPSVITPAKPSTPTVTTTTKLVKVVEETPKPEVVKAVEEPAKPVVKNTTTSDLKSEKTVDEGASAAVHNASNTTSTSKPVTKGLTAKPFVLGAAIARGEKPPCICPDKVCSSKLDLAFVVDASAGAEPGGNEKMAEIMEFGRRIASAFRIDPEDSHLGLITYSTDAQVMLNFKHFNDADVLTEARDSILVKPNTGTFTGQALTLARDSLFKANHRSEALDIIVLITDGSSNDDVLNPSRSLRDMGVKIIAVGLGDQVNKQQLSDIASDPDEEHMFTAEFDNLSPVIRKVQKASCIGGLLKDPVTPCRCDEKGVNANPEAELETAAFFSILKHDIIETGSKYNFIPYPPDASPHTANTFRRGNTIKHSLPISNPHPPEDIVQTSESAEAVGSVNNQESQTPLNPAPEQGSRFHAISADNRGVSQSNTHQSESSGNQNAPIQNDKQINYNNNNGNQDNQGSSNHRQDNQASNAEAINAPSNNNNNVIDNQNNNDQGDTHSSSVNNNNNGDTAAPQQTNIKPAATTTSQFNSGNNGRPQQQVHHQQEVGADANYMETDEPEYTSPNEDERGGATASQGKFASQSKGNEHSTTTTTTSSANTRNTTVTSDEGRASNMKNTNNNNNNKNNNKGNGSSRVSSSPQSTSNQSGGEAVLENSNTNSNKEDTSNDSHRSSSQNDETLLTNSNTKSNNNNNNNNFISNGTTFHDNNDLTGDEARGGKSPKPILANSKTKQNYAAESINGYAENSQQDQQLGNNQQDNKVVGSEINAPQRKPMRSESDSKPDDVNDNTQKISSPAAGRGIVNRHNGRSNQDDQQGQVDNRDSGARTDGGQQLINGDNQGMVQNDDNGNQQQKVDGQLIMNNNRSPRPNPIQVQVSVDVENAKGDKQKDVTLEPNKAKMKGSEMQVANSKEEDMKENSKQQNQQNQQNQQQNQQQNGNENSANNEADKNSEKQPVNNESKQNQADNTSNGDRGDGEKKERDENKANLVENKKEADKEENTGPSVDGKEEGRKDESRKQTDNRNNNQSSGEEEKQNENKMEGKGNNKQKNNEEVNDRKPNETTKNLKEEKKVEESSNFGKDQKEREEKVKPDVEQNESSKESGGESKQTSHEAPAQNGGNQVKVASQTEINNETSAYNQPATSPATNESPQYTSNQESVAALPVKGQQQQQQSNENENVTPQQTPTEVGTQSTAAPGVTNNGHGFTFTTTIQPDNIQNQTQNYQNADSSQQNNAQETGSSGVENNVLSQQQQQQQQSPPLNQVSPQEVSPPQDQSGTARLHENEAVNLPSNNNNQNKPFVASNQGSTNDIQPSAPKTKLRNDNRYTENNNANQNGNNESQTNANAENMQQSTNNNNQEPIQQNQSTSPNTYNTNDVSAENSNVQSNRNNNNNQNSEADRHTGTNRDIDLTALNPGQSGNDVNRQQQDSRQSQTLVGANQQRPNVGLKPLLDVIQKQQQQQQQQVRPLANQNNQNQGGNAAAPDVVSNAAARPTPQLSQNQELVYGKGSSSKEQTTQRPSSIASKLQQGNNYEAVNVGQGYETINDIVKYPHHKFGGEQATQDKNQASTNGNHNIDNKNTAEIDKKLQSQEFQGSKQNENAKASQQKQENDVQAAKPGNFQLALKESSKAVQENTKGNGEKEKDAPSAQHINNRPNKNNAATNNNNNNNNKQTKGPSISILKDTNKNNGDEERKTDNKAEQNEKEPSSKANNQPSNNKQQSSFNNNNNNNGNVALTNNHMTPMQRNDENTPQTAQTGNQNVQIQKLVPLVHHLKNYQAQVNNQLNNANSIQNGNTNAIANNNNNVNNVVVDNNNIGTQHGIQEAPVQQHLAFRLVRKPQMHIMGQPNNDVDSVKNDDNSNDSQSNLKTNEKKPDTGNGKQFQNQGDISDENKGKKPLVDNGIYKDNGDQTAKQEDSQKGAGTPSDKNTHQAPEPSANEKSAKEESQLSPAGKEQGKAEQFDKKPTEQLKPQQDKKPSEAKSEALVDSPRPQAPPPAQVSSKFADQGSKSASSSNQAPQPSTQPLSNPSPPSPPSNSSPSPQFTSKPSSQQSSSPSSNSTSQSSSPSNSQPSAQSSAQPAKAAAATTTNTAPKPTQPPPPDPESEALMKEVDQTGQEMEQTMQESEQEMNQNEAESEQEMQKNEQETGDSQTRSGMRHHIARKDEPPGQNVEREDPRSGVVAITTGPKVHKSLTRIKLAKDQNPAPEKGILLMDPFLDATHYWPLETQDKNSSPDVVTGKLSQMYNVGIVDDGNDQSYASTEKTGASINLGDFNGTCFSDPEKCILGGLTVAFWIYLDTSKIRPDQDAYIVSDGGQSMKAHGFAFVHFHGKYVFILSTTDKQWKMTFDELPNKSWHFMTFVWDKNSLLTFYLDGEKTKSVGSKTTNRTKDLFTNLTISMPDNANDISYMFPLRIASFALWDKALKEKQVKTASYLITRLHTGKKTAQKKHIINHPKTQPRGGKPKLLSRLMPQLR